MATHYPPYRALVEMRMHGTRTRVMTLQLDYLGRLSVSFDDTAMEQCSLFPSPQDFADFFAKRRVHECVMHAGSHIYRFFWDAGTHELVVCWGTSSSERARLKGDSKMVRALAQALGKPEDDGQLVLATEAGWAVLTQYRPGYRPYVLLGMDSDCGHFVRRRELNPRIHLYGQENELRIHSGQWIYTLCAPAVSELPEWIGVPSTTLFHD